MDQPCHGLATARLRTTGTTFPWHQRGGGLAAIGRALRAGLANRVQHVLDRGDSLVRRDARRRIPTGGGEGVVAGRLIGAVKAKRAVTDLARSLAAADRSSSTRASCGPFVCTLTGEM
jgi:hypothetical protein